jgi:cytochrome c-type biogenesis protein CcmH/NrfG
MAQAEKDRLGYVKKETMIIVAFICLGIGFIGGIAFGIYKTDTTMPVQPQGTPQQLAPSKPQPQGPMPEQSALIRDLELKTSTNPKDVQSWTQLANTYFDINQYVKAINAYEKSVALAPGDPNVLTDLGVMYRRNKQPREAIASFDKAISADPRHETSHFNKGIVLMHDLNDLDGAVKAWEALLEVNPNAMAPGGKQSIKEMLGRFKSSMN